MLIREIGQDRALIREFLAFPARLYRQDPHWIRPLDKDIEAVFDPKKNKFFRHGECTRWLLVDEQGQTLGRVAAFIDRKQANKFEQPTGGMGFFECVDDQQAAFVLFDTCREWLAERGMAAMDGPVNFGTRERWWGLLVKGFTPPNYGMFYHFPYYQAFFEAYGFTEYFRQFTYRRGVMDPLKPRVWEKAERIRKNPRYEFRHIRKDQLPAFAEDFRTIYNQAWVKHDGVGKMPKAQALLLMQQMKPVLDEKIVWFAYYDDQPVGFFVMLPELNQLFRYVNGRLDAWGKAKFVWYRWRGACRKMFGVVFGIVPDHQGKGVEAAIVTAAADVVQVSNRRYDEFEMNWIGDFNPRMMRVAEEVGGTVGKVHVTYRYLFDRSQPPQRAKVIA